MTSRSMDTCFNAIDWTPRPLEFFRYRYVPLKISVVYAVHDGQSLKHPLTVHVWPTLKFDPINSSYSEWCIFQVHHCQWVVQNQCDNLIMRLTTCFVCINDDNNSLIWIMPLIRRKYQDDISFLSVVTGFIIQIKQNDCLLMCFTVHFIITVH